MGEMIPSTLLVIPELNNTAIPQFIHREKQGLNILRENFYIAPEDTVREIEISEKLVFIVSLILSATKSLEQGLAIMLPLAREYFPKEEKK
jgi:hypothetical protein